MGALILNRGQESAGAEPNRAVAPVRTPTRQQSAPMGTEIVMMNRLTSGHHRREASRSGEPGTLMTAARRGLLAAGLAAAIALVAGCGSVAPATPAPPRSPALSGLHAVSAGAARTYLGTVTGAPALIGIVLERGQARAYVCDGTQQRVGTLADWFAGPVRHDQLTAVSSQHHIRLTARLTGQDATGTLALADGRILRFAIAVAPAGDQRAGIFAGTARWHGRTYRAGWIILPDHQQRGAAYYPSSPARGQVNATSQYPTNPIRGQLIAISQYPTGPIRGQVNAVSPG